MKKLHIILFFSCLQVSFLFLLQPCAAQTPGSPDLSFQVLSTFNNSVRASAEQNDGKLLVSGDFTYYQNTPVKGLLRLNTDGSLDQTFNTGGAGFNGTVSSIRLSGTKILVAGNFTSYNGTTANYLIRLNADGTADATFNASISGSISSMVLQSDGKILIGGSFGISRLNADGSTDASFTAAVNGNVYSIAIQSDNKIIAGGGFSIVNTISLSNICRLNTDGTLDNTFAIGTGFNLEVLCLAIQADGAILAGGNFTTYNSTTANHLVRLLSAGTIDSGFSIGTGFNVGVSSLAIQTDNKIVAGGGFTTFNGSTARCIVRLTTSGAADGTFNSGAGIVSAQISNVYTLTLLANGQLFVGGYFMLYNNAIRKNALRINADGTADNAFGNSAGASYAVNSIDLQTDGKIIIAGNFTAYGSTAINRIVRLNSDGSIDPSFTVGTGADQDINKVLIQPDGKILIAGLFNQYNGTTRRYIARLNADGTLDNTFAPSFGGNGEIRDVVLLSSGKYIIAGVLDAFDLTDIGRIARLNANGTLDNTFNSGYGCDDFINDLELHADGTILLAGYFSTYNNVSRYGIARIHSDGTLDTSFDPGTGTNNEVNAVKTLVDGSILLCGVFSKYNNINCHGLVKLNTSGVLDNTFTPAPILVGAGTISQDQSGNIYLGFGNHNPFIQQIHEDGSLESTFFVNTDLVGSISCIVPDPSGKLLIGGLFTTANASYNNIGRLNTSATITTTAILPSISGSSQYTISAWPCPAASELTIHTDAFSSSGVYTIRIISSNGESVLTTKMTSGESILNVSSLKEGTYLYQLSKDNEPIGSARFVIMH